VTATPLNRAARKYALKPAAYPFGRLILGTLGMIFVFSMIA
jgi:hypothetical protein